MNQHRQLEHARATISARVRELRKERHWTQAELSQKLQLSQSRLSEIERGDGSFTAEQFLLILKLFNVGASEFAPARANAGAELQSVLARLGAGQLVEDSEVLPSERIQRTDAAIREALALGTPRLVTALAPVIVRGADRLNLRKLHLELSAAGLEKRLGWLAANTLAALRAELAKDVPAVWSRTYRRAEVLLRSYLESVAPKGWRPSSEPPDVLDTNIRSKTSLNEVAAASSSISRRWGVITGIQPQDFVDALRGARVARLAISSRGSTSSGEPPRSRRSVSASSARPP